MNPPKNVEFGANVRNVWKLMFTVAGSVADVPPSRFIESERIVTCSVSRSIDATQAPLGTELIFPLTANEAV